MAANERHLTVKIARAETRLARMTELRDTYPDTSPIRARLSDEIGSQQYDLARDRDLLRVSTGNRAATATPSDITVGQRV